MEIAELQKLVNYHAEEHAISLLLTLELENPAEFPRAIELQKMIKELRKWRGDPSKEDVFRALDHVRDAIYEGDANEVVAWLANLILSSTEIPERTEEGID